MRESIHTVKIEESERQRSRSKYLQGEERAANEDTHYVNAKAKGFMDMRLIPTDDKSPYTICIMLTPIIPMLMLKLLTLRLMEVL